LTPTAEILLEGSYLYYEKEVNYSQENFKFVSFSEGQGYHIYAEILSRIQTGEFLKVIVRVEMNHNFIPLLVRTEKSIGNKYAQELYVADTTSQELHYTFQTTNFSQDFTRPFSAKHYLTSPAACTAALFTLSRKFDATGRTPVVFISSENDWTYKGPPTEKVVYAEYLSRELPDFKLHGSSLPAAHLCLYEFDSSHAIAEAPLEVFLSKHYAIPYQLLSGDQKIVIKNLKKNF